MRRLASLSFLFLLAGCATPGHVDQGGSNRVAQVFIAGVSPTAARQKVIEVTPRILTLIEQTPDTLVYRTPEPVRPQTFARWDFAARDGGTMVSVHEEYHAGGQVLVVNSPAYLDQEQIGLNALKSLLVRPVPLAASHSAGSVFSGSPHKPAPSRRQCAAITRAGHRCRRLASPGSIYCWQHGG